MASILVLSKLGRNLPLAGRLKNEGHIVKVWFESSVEALKGSRNPAVVKNPTYLLEQFDLVVSEEGLGAQADKIEKAGKRVMGCSTVTDKLILDKAYQAKVLDFLGVVSDPIEGLELELTGFMSTQGFDNLVMLSLPSYLFMEGDKGIKTGGMGSLVVFLDKGTKLAKALLPFEMFLLKAGYIGGFTLKMQVKGELWHILELGTTFIPESILAGAELLKTSLFDYLFGLQEGVAGQVWDGLGMSVVTSVPPWPYGGVATTKEMLNIPEAGKKHFSLGDPLLGVLGVVSAKGSDVREVRRRVYRTVGNSVSDREVQYRSDIGIIQEKDLQTLKEWGWL